MSASCRALSARERGPDNARYEALYPAPAFKNPVPTLRAKGRDSDCGVENKDVFVAGPMDGFTPATQSESRPFACDKVNVSLPEKAASYGAKLLPHTPPPLLDLRHVIPVALDVFAMRQQLLRDLPGAIPRTPKLPPGGRWVSSREMDVLVELRGWSEYKPDDIEKFSAEYFATPEERLSFKARHLYRTQIGANAHFLGSGATKFMSSKKSVEAIAADGIAINSAPGALGVPELLTMEKNPKTIRELQNQGLVLALTL